MVMSLLNLSITQISDTQTPAAILTEVKFDVKVFPVNRHPGFTVSWRVELLFGVRARSSRQCLYCYCCWFTYWTKEFCFGNKNSWWIEFSFFFLCLLPPIYKISQILTFSEVWRVTLQDELVPCPTVQTLDDFGSSSKRDPYRLQRLESLSTSSCEAICILRDTEGSMRGTLQFIVF